MVYRGMPIEQARQHFEELKSGEPPKLPVNIPVVTVRRKLRIPAESKKDE